MAIIGLLEDPIEQFENRLFNEDCLITLSKIPDNSVNLIFTSPPYANQRKNSYGGVDENYYIEWFIPIAMQIKRVLANNGSFFLNIKEHTNPGTGRSLYVAKLIIAIVEDCGFMMVDTLCWTKQGFPGRLGNKFKNAWEPIYHFALQPHIYFDAQAVATPLTQVAKDRASRKKCGMPANGSNFGHSIKADSRLYALELALPSNHIHCVNVQTQHSHNKYHSAVFPSKLPEFFIKAYTKEGELVYDPFSGSGTTLHAAKKLNRLWCGSEVQRQYFLKSYYSLLK